MYRFTYFKGLVYVIAEASKSEHTGRLAIQVIAEVVNLSLSG